jgi:hypothetical protein
MGKKIVNNWPHSTLKTPRRRFINRMLFGTAGLFAGSVNPISQQSLGNQVIKTGIPRPLLDKEYWPITGNPDLGEYNSPNQQPVDFAVWQAADGKWQLWSCIRGSKFPGTSFTTRFLYGWEGESLTSENWKPQGIKWVADPSVGETPGGIQAPYVFREDNVYYLFYGDWKRICLAKSLDGKTFTRVPGGNGQPDLFSEEHSHLRHGMYDTSRARDPMVIKRGNTYYCYYTSHLEEPVNDGWGFCRASLNLKDWSESVIVSHTQPGKNSSPRYSDECPHVVYLPEYNLYYLFVTQMYGKSSQTTVYASPNPMYFGIDDDSRKICTLPISAPEIVYDNEQYYLFSLNPGLDGISATMLRFVEE